MPSLIIKRGVRRYRASVTVKGITRQKLFPDNTKKSEKATLLWEHEMRKKLEQELEKAATDYLMVIDWAEEYLDEIKHRLKPKTYKEKRSVFQRFFKESGISKNWPVADITKNISRNFLLSQAAKRSGNAANKDRKNLGAAWEWGHSNLDNWPDGNNPFLSIARFKELRSPRYVPPEEDFWKVFDVAVGQDRVMLSCLIYLAARRGEIFNLTWRDVDFQHKQVRLWTNKRSGGREYDWLPMVPDLREELLWWWHNRPLKEPEHVFVCLGELPCHVSYHGKPFKIRKRFMRSICKRAGVKPFGFHSIRHITSTILYHKGYALSTIQAVLRHKNPNTTTRYLKTLGQEHLRKDLKEGLKRPAKVIRLRDKKVLNE